MKFMLLEDEVQGSIVECLVCTRPIELDPPDDEVIEPSHSKVEESVMLTLGEADEENDPDSGDGLGLSIAPAQNLKLSDPVDDDIFSDNIFADDPLAADSDVPDDVVDLEAVDDDDDPPILLN
jgi:hypothetical protein